MTVYKIGTMALLGFYLSAFADLDNLDTDQFNAKHMPKQIETEGTSVFVFSPQTQRWYVYNREGELVRSGHGSGGRDYCEDLQEPCRTPEGTFYVDNFGGPDCLSMELPEVGRVPMPYCMHVTGDFSIHGYSHVPKYNASHGCIRVTPAEAEWLHDNIIEYGTKVIVLPY